MKPARLAGGLLSLLLAVHGAAPALASACSVCFSAKNRDNQIAYLATTGFLTFLPLLMVGALVLWIRKRSRELDEAPRGSGPWDPASPSRLSAVPRTESDAPSSQRS